MSNLLPARGGDVVRALESENREGLSRSSIFGTVVVERIGDLLFMFALLSCVLLAYPALPAWLKHAGLVLAVVTVLALAVLAIGRPGRRRSLVPAAANAFRRFTPGRLVDRGEHIAQSFLEGISGALDARRLAGFMCLTGAAWIVEVLILYFVAGALDLSIPFGNLLFVLLFIAIGTMVPSSPGFVGTYEFFGISALEIVGVSGPVALAYVLILHAVTLLGSSALGALCLFQSRTFARAHGPGS